MIKKILKIALGICGAAVIGVVIAYFVNKETKNFIDNIFNPGTQIEQEQGGDGKGDVTHEEEDLKPPVIEDGENNEDGTDDAGNGSTPDDLPPTGEGNNTGDNGEDGTGDSGETGDNGENVEPGTGNGENTGDNGEDSTGDSGETGDNGENGDKDPVDPGSGDNSGFDDGWLDPGDWEV